MDGNTVIVFSAICKPRLRMKKFRRPRLPFCSRSQKFCIAERKEQNDEHISNTRKICCWNPKYKSVHKDGFILVEFKFFLIVLRNMRGNFILSGAEKFLGARAMKKERIALFTWKGVRWLFRVVYLRGAFPKKTAGDQRPRRSE